MDPDYHELPAGQSTGIIGNTPTIREKQWGTPKLITPTFRGYASERPMRFLSELDKYRQALGPQCNIKVIIEQSLTNLAKDWWRLVEDNVETWENFKEEFIQRFWNDEVQYQVHQNLNFG